MSKCSESITSSSKKLGETPYDRILVFALYVKEKHSKLGKRDRRIAEKRISDILFEIEMSLDKDAPTNSPATPALTNIQVMPYENFGNDSYVNMTSPLA